MNRAKRITAYRRHLCNSSVETDNVILSHDADSGKKIIINEYGETEVRQYRQEQKQLSAAEIEQVIAEYQAGKTTYQLAEEYVCHRQTISRALKTHGIEPNRDTAQRKLDADGVIRLYAEFRTSGEIAKLYDVHPNAILRCLRANGVKIRTKNDYPKK